MEAPRAAAAPSVETLCGVARRGYTGSMTDETPAPADDAADAEARAKKLEDALRADGVRITRQRGALLQVLAEADDHPDATELHRRARDIDESVSLATVYRTLATLEEQGVVLRHVFEGEAARFETSDTPHHDHIIDVETGEIIEFTSERIESIQQAIADALGYEVVSHRLELYCRRKPD